MRKIKFHTAEYEVVGINVTAVRFAVTLKKGDATIDSIVADSVNAENITITEDDTVKAIYSGYTKRIAISIYDDENVSIELMNTDLEAQIVAIENSVNAVQSTVSSVQAEQANQGAAIEGLADSQATQDLAIEDLGDAVSELAEG